MKLEKIKIKTKGIGAWDRVLLKLITYCRLHYVNLLIHNLFLVDEIRILLEPINWRLNFKKIEPIVLFFPDLACLFLKGKFYLEHLY